MFWVILLLFSTLLAASAVTAAERSDTVVTSGRDGAAPESFLPAILAPLDAIRYHSIFALQAEAHWADADDQIALLDDRLLVGNVLAQRYLHHAYKPSFAELRDWLLSYAYLPAAAAIRTLALKRRPPGGGLLPQPESTPIALRGVADDRADLWPASRPSRSDSSAARESAIHSLVRSNPAAAEIMLREADAAHELDDGDYDEASADLAEVYLSQGESQKALLMTQAVRTDAFRPLAVWDAGLAAWRLGRLAEARSSFETLARTPTLSRWAQSAAAFWAARVQARAGRPDLAATWLRAAAEHERTFYGLLAGRTLRAQMDFNFEPASFTDIDLNAVAVLPAARRALALLQAGKNAEAELELRGLASGAPVTLYPALAALAERGNMPALSLQLATMLSEVDGARHDPTLYPLPRWRPQGGFSVDRALVFALIRQESEFLPEARSSAGAVGLMQLMPGTAQGMATRVGITLQKHGKPGSLTDPGVNLALGQEFLSWLLKHDQINGNLILVAAAYNGGPSNLPRWQARPEYRDDPMLFLETLANRETRNFVERVLTNYWVYRLRLGQPTRDLDALAAGGWPVYVGLDDRQDQEARHVAAR
jgi:soluble lytic murein transglycosylase-like protein